MVTIARNAMLLATLCGCVSSGMDEFRPDPGRPVILPAVLDAANFVALGEVRQGPGMCPEVSSCQSGGGIRGEVLDFSLRRTLLGVSGVTRAVIPKDRMGLMSMFAGTETPIVLLVGEVEDLAANQVCGFTGPTDWVSWTYGFMNEGEFRGGMFVVNQAGTRLVAIEALLAPVGFDGGVNERGQTYEQFLEEAGYVQSLEQAQREVQESAQRVPQRPAIYCWDCSTNGQPPNAVAPPYACLD